LGAAMAPLIGKPLFALDRPHLLELGFYCPSVEGPALQTLQGGNNVFAHCQLHN
jgi:hypothetical protein